MLERVAILRYGCQHHITIRLERHDRMLEGTAILRRGRKHDVPILLSATLARWSARSFRAAAASTKPRSFLSASSPA